MTSFQPDGAPSEVERSPRSRPALAFEGISKRYGRDVWALSEATFEVGPGEVVGLVGPNGAGKSTALALAAGLIRPSSGKCEVLGVDVGVSRRTPPAVGVVVEQPRFVRSLDARANLRMLASVSEVADPDGIDPILEEVGLTGAGDRKVGAYSLGMRQRLGIAQALMERPRLLLVDEPANGLDPVGITEIRDLLAARAAQGVAIIVASHALTELESLCDRVMLIREGRLHDEIDVGREPARIRLRIDQQDQPRIGQFVEVVDQRPAKAGTLELVIEHQPVARLVDTLVGADIEVRGIWEERRTLESVYLDLVTQSG